jgi:hypothetical protein
MNRKEQSVRVLTTFAPALGLVLGVVGCGATNQDDPDINVNPLTQEEATASLQQIKARSGDPMAQVALRQMMPALDRLNGMLARVEVEPGTFVSFYEPSPGQVLISERGPLNGNRVVSAAQSEGMSVLDLYRQLAKAEPPAALVAAHEREVAGAANDTAGPELAPGQAVYTPPSDTTTATGALTAADGQFWRDWGCFVYGAGYADVAGCYPNWANGGYGQANTRTSFFVVAPFAGDAVSVRMQYQGSTKFQDPAFVGEWDGWWYHSSINTSRVTGPEYNIKTHRWDILQATGDQFHWSVAFKWNCSGTWACDQWPVRD